MFKNPVRSAHGRALEAFSHVPGFDRSTFVRLTIDTSPATVLQMLRQFLKSLEGARQQLDDVGSKADDEIVGKVCHKILGSSQLLGFGGLTRSIQNIRNEMKKPGVSEKNYMSWTDDLVMTIDAMTSFLELHCAQDDSLELENFPKSNAD